MSEKLQNLQNIQKTSKVAEKLQICQKTIQKNFKLPFFIQNVAEIKNLNWNCQKPQKMCQKYSCKSSNLAKILYRLQYSLNQR